MLTLLAFWKQRRKAGLELGSGPPVFTAIAISFPMRVNCLAILSQRANMVCFLTSKILPIDSIFQFIVIDFQFLYTIFQYAFPYKLFFKTGLSPVPQASKKVIIWCEFVMLSLLSLPLHPA